MKFLLDIMRCGTSCSSSMQTEAQEPERRRPEKTRSLMGRRCRRTTEKRVLPNASAEWKPTLHSISEDNFGADYDRMKSVVKGRVGDGRFGSRSQGVSPLRVKDYISRGNHFAPAIPTFSAAPFII
ncbi:hypothetical protein K2173_003110 [Erythroxylum novogranatense]|uniref:Uncharacterized protein n=1 Tax=Erythroxylum novogranatense TaxID=1862640 RepID=A0AAV8TBZ5_9ROSI|nr:hypothetical protein K2173_003110 [Erythroxylum novogranatense]